MFLIAPEAPSIIPGRPPKTEVNNMHAPLSYRIIISQEYVLMSRPSQRVFKIIIRIALCDFLFFSSKYVFEDHYFSLQ